MVGRLLFRPRKADRGDKTASGSDTNGVEACVPTASCGLSIGGFGPRFGRASMEEKTATDDDDILGPDPGDAAREAFASQESLEPLERLGEG
jgi:hypothetical protein